MRRKSRAKPEGSIQCVFLVGFMGAGKSTVGRALADRLNWFFEDLDERIERREQRSVPEIFRTLGEPAFRQAETAALKEVLEELRSGSARVVALGGGAFAQPANVELLQAAGVPTVFLDAPVEELWRRCCLQANQTGGGRPLLQSVAQFAKLYDGRRSSYSQAALKVNTGQRTVEAVADEIAVKLRLKKLEVRTEQGEAE